MSPQLLKAPVNESDIIVLLYAVFKHGQIKLALTNVFKQ